MARGINGRSQASQSQSRNAPRPSQPQRAEATRRARVEDEEDLGDEYQDAMDEDEEEGEGGDNDITRKAHALVRLALFNEQKRTPLRREEISKKVMGSKTRQFKEVFSVAQGILRQTFGMELIEIQQRIEEQVQVPPEAAEMLNSRKKGPTGTKTYILRSVLPVDLIELAAEQDDEIFVLEQQERGPNDDMDDSDEGISPSIGAIFSWQTSDQLGNIGILYVILALILVNGKAILEVDLRRLLKRLRLHGNAIIPLNSLATHTNTDIDTFLTQCLRQGHLERLRVGEGKAGAKKRGRVQMASQQQDDGEVWEWRWGPRAASEISEKDVAAFVAEFMVQTAQNYSDDAGAANGNEEEDERVRQKRMEENRDKMLKGIERAAGGSLAGLV